MVSSFMGRGDNDANEPKIVYILSLVKNVLNE